MAVSLPMSFTEAQLLLIKKKKKLNIFPGIILCNSEFLNIKYDVIAIINIYQ